jgi:hypothetical protein
MHLLILSTAGPSTARRDRSDDKGRVAGSSANLCWPSRLRKNAGRAEKTDPFDKLRAGSQGLKPDVFSFTARLKVVP